MGDTAAITNDIQTLIGCFQFFIHSYFHVIEFYFHAIQQCIIIGSTGSNLIQRIDHFDDTIQDSLRQYQAQITGCCVEGRCHKGITHTVGCTSASADQITKTLHNHTAAQHITQTGNAFAIAIGILEGFRKMLGYQQCEVCILCLLCGVFIAVTIYRNDAVCIFIYHSAFRVHAEGTHQIAVFLGTVYNLAFIKLICQVRKNFRRQLYAHTQIHAVGLCGNIHFLTYPFHPFAADTANGDHAFFTAVGRICTFYFIAVFDGHNSFHRCIKEESYFILQFCIQIFQNDIVDVRAQMAHGSIQEMQVILDTEFFEFCACSRVQLCALAAVAHIDIIYIMHQIQCLFFANVFIQCAAKIIRNVIFAIGKSTCAAKAAHDGTALAVDTAFDLIPIDGTVPFFQRMSCFKYCHLQRGVQLCQLICRKNTPWTCANNDHIILHLPSSLFRKHTYNEKKLFRQAHPTKQLHKIPKKTDRCMQ